MWSSTSQGAKRSERRLFPRSASALRSFRGRVGRPYALFGHRNDPPAPVERVSKELEVLLAGLWMRSTPIGLTSRAQVGGRSKAGPPRSRPHPKPVPELSAYERTAAVRMSSLSGPFTGPSDCQRSYTGSRRLRWVAMRFSMTARSDSGHWPSMKLVRTSSSQQPNSAFWQQ